MSKSSRSVIGITLGDPFGIGPEVIAKALSAPRVKNKSDFLVIGDFNLFRSFRKERFPYEFFDLKNVPSNKIQFGKPTTLGAQASLDYLDTAISLLKTKQIHALVTAPVCKESICSLGVRFQGHTEYLAQAFHTRKFGMMFVSEELKTILVTRHIPLKSVSQELTQRNIFETIELVDASLKKYFRIRKPRVAVCGLNPHAGEGGVLGDEEVLKIIPAMRRARQQGIQVFGPLPGDTAFIPQQRKLYDAFVAMYHDQGLIMIKGLYFDSVVNFTCGLPFIRTSPAHGTAFDIAGKNVADPTSMIHAIKLAQRLSALRSDQ